MPWYDWGDGYKFKHPETMAEIREVGVGLVEIEGLGPASFKQLRGLC